MIETDYECPDCGRVEAVRHSIRERPEHKCPECGAAMARIISGGLDPLVKGGTVRGGIARSTEAKNASDLAHARTVAEKIKSELQPKTRAAILRGKSGAK